MYTKQIVIGFYLQCSWSERRQGKTLMNSSSHLWETLAQLIKVTDVLLPRTSLFYPQNLYFPLVYWFLVIERERLSNIFIWELRGAKTWEGKCIMTWRGVEAMSGELRRRQSVSGKLFTIYWRTERLARGRKGRANEKSIQSQVSPLMDEEDTWIDEKALSPVASWLTSLLFWLVAQWKDSVYQIMEYMTGSSLCIQVTNRSVLLCCFEEGWLISRLGRAWIFTTET